MRVTLRRIRRKFALLRRCSKISQKYFSLNFRKFFAKKHILSNFHVKRVQNDHFIAIYTFPVL